MLGQVVGGDGNKCDNLVVERLSQAKVGTVENIAVEPRYVASDV